jgi:transposase
MDIVIIGIDLGKNSCSVAGLDASGRVVLRRRMRRTSLESFVDGLGRCIVAMEACCGAHHLGRVFAAQGREVRLMSPEYVRPYVKAQKNDDLDAEAIAEAATRPTMRFVEVKSQARSDVQALHRARRLRLRQQRGQRAAGAPAPLLRVPGGRPQRRSRRRSRDSDMAPVFWRVRRRSPTRSTRWRAGRWPRRVGASCAETSST